MSEQFEMLVWRANEVDTNGDLLTSAALLSMADVLVTGKDITIDLSFATSVGKIVQAWVRNQELWVTAVFTDCDIIEAIREKKMCLRPGFSIESSSRNENGVRVIDKVGKADVGLMTTVSWPLPSTLPSSLVTSQ